MIIDIEQYRTNRTDRIGNAEVIRTHINRPE